MLFRKDREIALLRNDRAKLVGENELLQAAVEDLKRRVVKAEKRMVSAEEELNLLRRLHLGKKQGNHPGQDIRVRRGACQWCATICDVESAQVFWAETKRHRAMWFCSDGCRRDFDDDQRSYRESLDEAMKSLGVK